MPTLQPRQEQVSKIIVKINAKLTKFQATQITVVILFMESPTANVVNTVKECVDNMTQDITALQDTYTKISIEI